MAILLKSGEEYFELSDEVLKKSKITKEQYEKAREKGSGDVAGQSWDSICSLVDLSTCCWSKQSYWASC